MTSVQLKKDDDASFSFLPSSCEMPSINSVTTNICESSENDLLISTSFPSIPSLNDISSIQFLTQYESDQELSGPSFLPSFSKIDSDVSSSMDYLRHSNKSYVIPPMFFCNDTSLTEDELDISESEPQMQWDYPISNEMLTRQRCDARSLGYPCNEHE